MSPSLLSALALGLRALVTSKAVRLALARQIMESVKAHDAQAAAAQLGPRAVKVLALLGLAAALYGCGALRRISSDDCLKLRAAESLACQADPRSVECQEAGALLDRLCRSTPAPPVEPTPPVTPPPNPPPVNPPQPPPVTPPPVTPPPAADPVEQACGVPMPATASAWVRAKQYGQAGGTDTELNVVGWPVLCESIHGKPISECHLEGLDFAQPGLSRVGCEMAVIKRLSGGKGSCPVGQWTNEWTTEIMPLLQVDPWEQHGMSGDHFGDTRDRDDPNTEPFEGKPAECGKQRDAAGHPMAGFWWMSHGKGLVRACLPDYTGCSRQWLEVDH